MKLLCAQLHFHSRHTGVTSHVESVVTVQQRLFADVSFGVFGYGISQPHLKLSLTTLVQAAKQRQLVLHAHRNLELMFALLLRLVFSKTAVVATYHTGKRPGRFTRFLLARADAVVSLNREQQQWLGTASRLISHGVDLQKYCPVEERALARAALKLPAGGRLVGVVGRIRPSKGQGDFVEAVRPLLLKYPEWNAVLFGHVAPAHRDFLNQLLVKLPGRIHWAGELTPAQMPFGYQSLDIVVQPSWSEAVGLVTLEGIVSGCAVAATNLAGLSSMIGPGAVFFESRQVAQLQKIVEAWMSSSKELKSQQALAMQQRCQFSSDIEARKLFEMYLEAQAKRVTG